MDIVHFSVDNEREIKVRKDGQKTDVIDAEGFYKGVPEGVRNDKEKAKVREGVKDKLIRVVFKVIIRGNLILAVDMGLRILLGLEAVFHVG